MPVCQKCKEDKEPHAFGVDNNVKGGLQLWCKVCRAESWANGSPKRTEEVREYLERTPCADCGELFPYYVLEIDHTDSSVERNRRHGGLRTSGVSLERFLYRLEVEKAEIVCANCHKIRTHERRAVAV